MRGQILGDVQADRTQPAGHQICSVTAQFELRCRLSASRTPGQPSKVDRAIPERRSGLRSPVPARMWPINPDHSSAPPVDRSASPPQSWGSSKDAVRPNPHRQDCAGDTMSSLVTRCAPRVISHMRGIDPCCDSGSEEPLRSTEDSVLHPLQRTVSTSHRPGREPRDAGCAATVPLPRRRVSRLRVVPRPRRIPADPTIRCCSPCAVSTSASGAMVSASSATSSQVTSSPVSGCRDHGSRFLPAYLVAGVRDGLCAALLVVLVGKLFQHADGLAVAVRIDRSSAASSSIRPSSRSRTVSVRIGIGSERHGPGARVYQYGRCWNG